VVAWVVVHKPCLPSVPQGEAVSAERTRTCPCVVIQPPHRIHDWRQLDRRGLEGRTGLCNRATSDAPCSGQELGARAEAASSARAPAAGAEAEGFRHDWKWEVLFAA